MKVYTLRVLTCALSLLYSAAGQIIANPATPTRACGSAFSMVAGFPFTPSTTDLPNAIAFSELLPATADYPNGYFFAATSNTASVASGPGNTISIYFVDAVTGKFTPAVGSPFSLASVINPTTGAISQPARGMGAATPTSIALAPLANGKVYGGFIQGGNSTSIFSIDINTGMPTLIDSDTTTDAGGNGSLTFSPPVSLSTLVALFPTTSDFDTSLFFASAGPEAIYPGVIDAASNHASTDFAELNAPANTTVSSVSFAPPLNNQLFFAGANTSTTQPGSVSIFSTDLVSPLTTPVPGSPFTLPGITHLSSVSVLPVVNVNTLYLAAVNADTPISSTIYLYSFDTATNKIAQIGIPVSAGAPGSITFSPAGICPFIAAMQNPNGSPLAGTINAFNINPLTATLSLLAGSPFDSGGTVPGPLAFSSLLPNNTLFAATVNHNTGSTPNIALFKTAVSSSVSLSASPATFVKGQSGTLTATLTGTGPFTLKISASTTPSTLTTQPYFDLLNFNLPISTIPLTSTITPTTEIMTISGSGPAISLPLTPSVTTQYQVISYTDGSGCSICGPSAPLTVPVDPITKVELTSLPYCQLGGAPFTAIITGGVPPYTISPYTGQSSQASSSIVLNNNLMSTSNVVTELLSFPSQYVPALDSVAVLRVTDATGNQANSNINAPLAKKNALEVNVTPSTISVAAGQSFTLTAQVALNGTFTPSFMWTGPNGFTSTASSITIDNAQATNAGTYTVTASISHTYTSGATEGTFACTGTASAEVTVTSGSAIIATSKRVCVGQTFSLTASIPGATSYSWTGPDGFTASTEAITITNAQLVNGGTYSVTATVGDSKVTASIVIDVGLFPSIVTGYQSALSKAIQAKYCA